MRKSSPKSSEISSVTNNDLSSPLMQDDYARGPRYYGKDGQSFLMFHLSIHLNRSHS